MRRAPFALFVLVVVASLSHPPVRGEDGPDQYTAEFTEKLTQAALQALADLRPAKLEWAVGQVAFAKNRRTADTATLAKQLLDESRPAGEREELKKATTNNTDSTDKK